MPFGDKMIENIIPKSIKEIKYIICFNVLLIKSYSVTILTL